MHTEFWWGILAKTVHTKTENEIRGRIIIECIFGK
jgi:hypothetical protein